MRNRSYRRNQLGYTFTLLLMFVNFASAQTVGENLKHLKKYLWLQKEINSRDFQNLEDINSFLSYIELIMNEDETTRGDASINFYFNELGVNFYKFITIGKTMEPYVKVVGIKAKNEVIEIDDPVATINMIVVKPTLPDSLRLRHSILIYNKLEFLGQDVKFFDKYDESAFDTRSQYNFFNRFYDTDSALCFTKLYIHKYNDFVDRIQITYYLEKDEFYIKKLLLSRN